VVFTGPIFRDDDMLYRGKYRIPALFWKVVAIVKDDGKLSATAYIQTQKNLI
jgi:endonuclease G